MDKKKIKCFGKLSDEFDGLIQKIEDSNVLDFDDVEAIFESMKETLEDKIREIRSSRDCE